MNLIGKRAQVSETFGQSVIIKAKNPNIFWFQALKCEDLSEKVNNFRVL